MSPVNDPLTFDLVSVEVVEGVVVVVELFALELFEVFDEEVVLFEEVEDDAEAFFVALLLVAFFAVTFAALELALALAAGAAACVAVTAAVAGTA